MKLVGKNAEILANHYKLCLEKKGYAFFDKDKAYNLNIIGVRKNDKFTNKFDDKIVLIYRDDYKVWNFHEFSVTTDPGEAALVDPMNPKGAAIWSLVSIEVHTKWTFIGESIWHFVNVNQ